MEHMKALTIFSEEDDLYLFYEETYTSFHENVIFSLLEYCQLTTLLKMR